MANADDELAQAGDEKDLAERLNEAQRGLKRLLEVNRKFHSTLTDKKVRAAELREENKNLQLRLECRTVEEKSRKAQLEQLQAKMHGEQSQQQADTLSMQKNVMVIQEKIALLNDENMHLSERHKGNKAKIAEQLGVMKALEKRIKELCRHIEFMAGHLNEAQVELQNNSVSRSQEDQRSVGGGSHAGDLDHNHSQVLSPSAPASIQDFYNLPGLNLQKLLGEDAHILTTSRSPSPPQQRPTSGGRS